MIQVQRVNLGDYLSQRLLDDYALAIKELQALVAGIFPAHRDVEQALVYVKNNTGGALGKGDVVGLGAPINDDPSSHERRFLHGELLMAGETPYDAEGHAGKFAVLDQPIGAGQIGVACVQGVVRVKVKIDDTGVADWADIDDGVTGNLLAAATGSAKILWYEGTEAGTVWAVCLIGLGKALTVEWGTADDSVSPITGLISTVDLIVTDTEGVAVDPAETITVYIRNDQSAVDITARAWDQNTLLSFVRSVEDSAGASGVLVGEPGYPAGYHSAIGNMPLYWECFTVLYVYDKGGKCVGWYYGDEHTWESPWGVADPEIL